MSTPTEFVPVKGYEGLYEVGRTGLVNSLPRSTHYMGVTRLSPGGILKGSINKRPVYQRVRLSKDGVAVSFSVHRLVAEAFLNNPKGLPQVNHKNGIQNDNRVENLEWTSSKGNMLHASITGLIAHGIRQHSAKLNETIVDEILQSKDSLKVLAIKYKVTPQAISKVRNGKTWQRQSLWGDTK